MDFSVVVDIPWPVFVLVAVVVAPFVAEKVWNVFEKIKKALKKK